MSSGRLGPKFSSPFTKTVRSSFVFSSFIRAVEKRSNGEQNTSGWAEIREREVVPFLELCCRLASEVAADGDPVSPRRPDTSITSLDSSHWSDYSFRYVAIFDR